MPFYDEQADNMAGATPEERLGRRREPVGELLIQSAEQPEQEVKAPELGGNDFSFPCNHLLQQNCDPTRAE